MFEVVHSSRQEGMASCLEELFNASEEWLQQMLIFPPEKEIVDGHLWRKLLRGDESECQLRPSSLPFLCTLALLHLQQMGLTHTSQTIRNRNFTNLELRDQHSPENGRLVGTVGVASQGQLDQWRKSLERIQKQEHFHMLLPLEWRVADSSLCGSSQLIELQYELYPKFLSEEAQLRSQQNRHLEESEIWYIVWALTEVAGQCAATGEKLRDISLDNIFMNSAGNIKILTPFSLPNLWDPYFDPSATDVYFSPEQLKGRQIGQMHNLSDSNKSVSFATGMLLLSLSLLRPLFHLYDYGKNTLNAQKLQEQLKSLENVQYLSAEFNIYQFYSESYQRLVRKLLQIDPSKRVTVTQVHENLQPNLQKIANLKPFQFDVPQPQAQLPSPNQPIKKSTTISLGSHKAKKQSLIQSPPPSESKTLKHQEESSSPISIPPLVESKYVSASSEVKQLGSGLDLLKRIDQRLMRSREEFPS